MRIGELADRSGVPARMLRYYEKQGLITAPRRPNGYRDYADDAVQRVRQIRELIASGVPTAIIERLTPCLDSPQQVVLHEDCPDILAMLDRQRDQLSERIDSLTRNRDAIDDYLGTVRSILESRETADLS